MSALALLAGCSLTRPSIARCETNRDCRDQFGFGWVCETDEGLCDPVPQHPRCDESFPLDLLESPERHPDTFLLGVIMDEAVETHRARAASVRLAVTEARDRGGIGGQRVGVIFCTNEEDPRIDGNDQLASTRELASYLGEGMGVVAIVGPPSSGATRAAFETLEGHEVVIISPSATSPSLTALEPPATDTVPGFLWRTAPPDSLQGRVIAQDMMDRGRVNVAVVAQAGDYGVGLTEVFASAFEGTVQTFTFDSETSRNAAASRAGEGAFDEVLFISSQTSDASAFLLFASSFAGYDGKSIFLTDSAANQDLLSDAVAASGLFDRVRGTRAAALAGPVFNNFVAAYAAANSGADVTVFSYTAHAYDATWLALIGATWASIQEPAISGLGVARGLRRVTGGVPVDIGPDGLGTIESRFAIGERVDVRGASGELNFDSETEETTAAIDVWTIDAAGAAFDVDYTVTP